MLAVGVIRTVERVAVSKRYVQRPRRPDPLGDEPKKADHYGRDAPSLELRSYQTHGLIADGSHRYQQRDVDLFLHEDLCYLRDMVA